MASSSKTKQVKIVVTGLVLAVFSGNNCCVRDLPIARSKFYIYHHYKIEINENLDASTFVSITAPRLRSQNSDNTLFYDIFCMNYTHLPLFLCKFNTTGTDIYQNARCSRDPRGVLQLPWKL
jgi:hypothetical protein